MKQHIQNSKGVGSFFEVGGLNSGVDQVLDWGGGGQNLKNGNNKKNRRAPRANSL